MEIIPTPSFGFSRAKNYIVNMSSIGGGKEVRR